MAVLTAIRYATVCNVQRLGSEKKGREEDMHRDGDGWNRWVSYIYGRVTDGFSPYLAAFYGR